MIHLNIRNIKLSDSISICDESVDSIAFDASKILQPCSCNLVLVTRYRLV